MNFYATLAQLEAENVPFAIATIIHATDNAPGRTSFKMCVTQDGRSFGSIGGGEVEYKVQKIARDMIRNGEKMRLFNESFNDKEGVGCGGDADILIETVIPRNILVIFGGGHVGTALTRYANDVGFNVMIYDDREEFAKVETHPGAVSGIHIAYEDIATIDLPQNAYFVILTHKHTGDRICLESLLKRPELTPKYIGCIGSSVKLGHMFKELLASGISHDALAKVYAPIGVDNGGVSAAEIAISIATQLIAVNHNKVLLDAMSAKKHPFLNDSQNNL